MWYGCSGWPRDLWEFSHCWNGDCKRGGCRSVWSTCSYSLHTYIFFASDRKCDVKCVDHFCNINRTVVADVAFPEYSKWFHLIMKRTKCLILLLQPAVEPLSGWRVCLHFFYMGLNDYIGSLLNYRLLCSPSVITLFLRLCCVQDCGFASIFFAWRVWVLRAASVQGSVLTEIRLTFSVCCLFWHLASHDWIKKMLVTMLVFSISAAVVSLCAFHYHNNAGTTFRSLFAFPRRLNELCFLSLSHSHTLQLTCAMHS